VRNAPRVKRSLQPRRSQDLPTFFVNACRRGCLGVVARMICAKASFMRWPSGFARAQSPACSISLSWELVAAFKGSFFHFSPPQGPPEPPAGRRLAASASESQREAPRVRDSTCFELRSTAASLCHNSDDSPMIRLRFTCTRIGPARRPGPGRGGTA